MPFPLLPLLAALGPLFMGGASLAGGAMANAANKKRAQEQMDFQERMSSTSYQRAMADMRMSGINPMLAYQQGGASSPGGAMAQMEDVVGPAVSSAMHARRLQEELRTMRQEREQALKTAGVHRNVMTSEIARNTASAGLLGAERELVNTHRVGALTDNASSAAQLIRTLNEAKVEKSGFGKVMPWLDRIRESIFPFLTLPRQGLGGRVRTRFTAPTARY